MTQDIHSGPGDLAPGEHLAGYEIQERIGRGGMAVVYRALDLRLGRLVALKVLAPHLGEDDAFRLRFMRESRAAAGFDHPHIIPVFEAGEAGGVLFIAMRYVPGGDVRSLIEAEGRLSPARTARMASQVASALDAAHAHGLVHRDVKPANILLGQASGSDADHVYLSDFGLSKNSLTSSTLTSTGQFLGTLDYVAPEQIQGQPIDGRADQYGLACAVVEMLTGAPPFRRDDSMALMWAQLESEPPRVTERRPELPSAVDDVITAAMSKAPAGRYASCSDFAAALVTALEPAAPRWSGHSAAQAEAVLGDSLRTDPFVVNAHPVDRFADLRHPAGGLTADPGSHQPAPGPWSDAPRDWFRGDGQGNGPVPGPIENFRQPSVHAAWPAESAMTRHEAQVPVLRPQQPGHGQAGHGQGGHGQAGHGQAGHGQGGHGRPSQHRGRNVGIGLLIAIVALCGAAGIAYKLSHRTHRSLPPVTVYKSVTPSAAAGNGNPALTVREYFAAINHHRYLEAWRLHGGAATEPYAKFRIGFSGTAYDVVKIQSVNGDVVTAKLTALQTDKTVKTFEGTYTVTNGVISATDVRQTN